MRKLIGILMALALFVAIADQADAQSRTRGGVYGMLNLADLGGDDVGDTDFLIGGGLGGFVSHAVHELVSIGLTANFSLQGAEDSGGDERTKLNYINIAPMLQLTPQVGEMAPVRPVFYVAPVFGFQISCKFDNGITEDCDTAGFDTESLVIGAMGGASLVIRDNFFVGGAYNLGFTSVAKDSDVDVKNNVIHFYAGISFPIGGGGGM